MKFQMTKLKCQNLQPVLVVARLAKSVSPSVIARSVATKQSEVRGWEIATSFSGRTRNDRTEKRGR
jgi:hypothetical protein